MQLMSWLGKPGSARNGECENSASLWIVVCDNLSTVKFDNFFADCQSQPGPPSPRAGLAGLHEFIEHRIQFVFRNTDAFV